MAMKGLVLLALAGVAASEKFEVVMRDGFKLATWVNCKNFTNGKKNFVYDTSPYGHWATENIADIFTAGLGDDDHCSVRQDMRGSGESQGMDFTLWHSSANDTYDTFKWLASQPWGSDTIYQCGASADGLGEIFGTFSNPPQLKKEFIMWASSSGYSFSYPGGAYRKALGDGWLSTNFPKQYLRLKQTAFENEAPNPWWDPVNVTGKCDIFTGIPSVQLAGWYDIFLNGNLQAYDCYNQVNPAATHIIVEACGHCLGRCPIYDDLDFESVPLAFMVALDQFAGNPIPEQFNKVTFRVLGAGDKDSKFIDPFAPGNYWTSLPEWPTYTPTRMYFTSQHTLAVSPEGTTTPFTYTYDPANPVPTLGGNNLMIACGAMDQSPVENRTDVLLFDSEVLEEPYVITGPLLATLFVKSNRVDTDFTVKLTDVYPDGKSLLINDGIIRMRWRRGEGGGSQPQMMTPGETYEVNVDLWNTSFIFAKGHKIRVAVSSSNDPRFAPNPNNGLPLVQNGTSYIAENTVLVGGDFASYFTMPVVKQSQLPKVDLLNVTKAWFAARPPSFRDAVDRFVKFRREQHH
eukprot:TRINITY_DN3907_c0_g2_i1.p1 TRINITY_DN3907_c0_g2~~TRINITY_DN3907_c0_g2_i1.p1  ORF type:complete len:573 (+),score=194.91 TRINITY_DN3907_c0_g2_i1:35-1753(+)